MVFRFLMILSLVIMFCGVMIYIYSIINQKEIPATYDSPEAVSWDNVGGNVVEVKLVQDETSLTLGWIVTVSGIVLNVIACILNLLGYFKK